MRTLVLSAGAAVAANLVHLGANPWGCVSLAWGLAVLAITLEIRSDLRKENV